MITSGEVRVNRKFKNVFALNTDKSHFAESHFAESHFAESHFAESHHGGRFQERDHQLFCNFDSSTLPVAIEWERDRSI